MIPDVEQLGTQMQVLWDVDEHDAVPIAHRAIVGVAADGYRLALGLDLPAGLVDEARRLVAGDPPGLPGPEPPTVLAPLAQLLGDGIELERSGGPGYRVPTGLDIGSPVPVVTSADPPATRAPVAATRPERWTAAEWADLTSGRAGAWAVVVVDDRVVAVCHTPAESAAGAEAGVWTDPRHRRRGYAAAVTAAWARAQPAGRPLFYSTSGSNRASQAVAARLGLRPLGWMWKLSEPGQDGTHAGRR